MLSIRSVVRAHLLRERFDVFLAVLAPLVIMFESGYANAWVFAGGKFDGFNGLLALGRGIFLEALIFTCFKLAKVFFTQRLWIAVVPLLVGMVGMTVSAGCNLGYIDRAGEVQFAVQAVAQFLPGVLVECFKLGLGLLFPIAVGVFALFDVSHLVQESLKSSHLDSQAIYVQRAEMHRTGYLKAQKKQGKKVQAEYNQICEADAQSMVSKVKQGDLSFGSDALKPVEPKLKKHQPSVQVSPVPGMSSLPPLHSAFPASAVPVPQLQPGAMPPLSLPGNGLSQGTLPPARPGK